MATNIRKIIGRVRYFHISHNIHLSDNNNNINKDRLHKIRHFTEKINEKCNQIFYPDVDLCVDESVVPFTGRLLIKQHFPDKPTKWGIKIYALAESKSGYILNFYIYDGKNSLNNLSTNEIFLKLLENYKYKNHHVYADRFFSNLKLIQSLRDQGFYYTGTANCHKKDFPEINKLKKGDIVYLENDLTSLLVWKSKKKPVYLITNYHSSKISYEKFYNKREKSITISEKPEAICSYNKNAKGVDLANRFCSYYRFSHRITRWWKAVFFHFIHVCVHNISILMNKMKKSKIPYKDVLLEIIEGMIKEVNIEINSNVMGKSKLHLPEKIPSNKGKKDNRKICKICGKKTNYTCTKCTFENYNYVALCVPKCFQKLHLNSKKLTKNS